MDVEDGVTTVEPRITLMNRGPLPLRGVKVEAYVKHGELMLAAGQSTPIDIPPNSQGTISLSVELALTNLSPELRNLLLFNDTVLDLSLRAEAGVGDLLSAKVEGEASIPWGAPLYGFSFGSPSMEVYNETHVKVSVPINFENHSPYIDLVGEPLITLLDEEGVEVGRGFLSINAPRGEAFEGEAVLYLDISDMVEELLFEDTELSYTVNVEWTWAGAPLAFSHPVSLEWGAPLYGLTVGSPSASIYNSSCLLIQVPLGFENHSPYIDLETTASLTLLNASTLQPVGMGVLPITVSSGGAFEGLATLYVNIDEEFLKTLVFNDVELQYILVAEVEVEGFQASMNLPVSYSWGAPLSDFQAGTPSLTTHNSTHFKVSTPLSFRNRSPIRVEGSLTMRVYDGENLIAQGTPVELGVEPGESFSGELEAYVAISDIHPGTFKVVVEASTGYGFFTQEVVLNV